MRIYSVNKTRNAYRQEMTYAENYLIDGDMEYKILTIQSEVLEPRSKQTLRVRAFSDIDTTPPENMVLITQNESYPESLIYMGSAMPSVRQREVLLDIINMSNERITLDTNTILTNASPVSELENYQNINRVECSEGLSIKQLRDALKRF